MATIKRNEEQENALKYITDHLAEINQLNPIIMGRFQEVTLSFAVGRGRLGTIKLPFASDDKEVPRLLALVSNRRTALTKEIMAKADKYNIALSAEDIAILDGKNEDSKVTKRAKKEHPDTKSSPGEERVPLVQNESDKSALADSTENESQPSHAEENPQIIPPPHQQDSSHQGDDISFDDDLARMVDEL